MTIKTEMETNVKKKVWADTLIIVTIIIGLVISTIIILPKAGLDSLIYWNWMFWLDNIGLPRIVGLCVTILLVIYSISLMPTVTYHDNKRKHTRIRRAVKTQGDIIYIYCSGGIVIKTHRSNIYRGINDWGVFNDYQVFQDGDEIQLETKNWELHNEAKLRHEFETSDEQRALAESRIRDLLRQGYKMDLGLIQPRYLDRPNTRYYTEPRDIGGDDDDRTRNRPRV